ncbi:adenylyl-sulfate kinase [Pseudomonas sp. ZM23]|uniref:Adenylyl-sulfate kinase n=1 Tax=Pseudomonas triclosanedens TaxID=2961893 RepID=A0ABY6ZX91_9PSED|nr:adenylyl-sulfate kinase [Pseudomonas triclosanedens]MCP8466755.1 adenylyl-sulfate kinase [Pseudomonas triclosanedens]MCP8469979.1 adenylyl-sulfate kinase [Pseudomonas triclosanedens]MCP8477889.1 adenylyl-sulfate kinase [Pseudomonas triclosanedens]WAI49310.1 adenylyl-sulfate kinase [Pseudomonas triclosanedens]
MTTDRNIRWHAGRLSIAERASRLRQQPATLWLTGLSGSGKSTLAFALEYALHELGYSAVVLDGDNVRHGLCKDLGFSHEDRTENIRRVAEVAHLMNDAGLIVITSFISPFRQDREQARAIIGEQRFREIHLSTTLKVCEQRDPKGLYKKARAGTLPEFTGISSPYEEPLAPFESIDTDRLSLEESVARLMNLLELQPIER